MKKLVKAIALITIATNLSSLSKAQDNVSSIIKSDDDVLTSEQSVPVDYFDKDKFNARTVVCPFKGQIDYDPGDISCGALAVPENREKARPRTIEIHYTKIHAKKPDDWNTDEKGEWIRRDDPVIYLTGGPGAQAQGYVERLKDHGIRETRDLYILEQRGIGWSDDFCLDYALIDPSISNTPDWDKYQRASLVATQSCFAAARAARVDLSGYSSIENARDVKALRKSLGIDQWNVWGISYGSILGQAYLKEDPDGIRAAVIDAIVPLQQDITFHNIARYYDRTLTILHDTCQEDKKCSKSFPDFKERMEAAILKTSLGAIEVDAIDTELFPTGKGYFFQDIIGGAAFTLFYEQDNYPALPAFIDAFIRLVEEEDYASLKLLTSSPSPTLGNFSQGMYNAIACNDNWHDAMEVSFTEDFTDYPALAMIFGDPALIKDQQDICKRYGMNPRPAEDYTAVQTDIRTLIVEGQMDPITPPPLAEKILQGFSNGTYVEFPYAGHGPTRSVECSGKFLTDFFNDPDGDLDLTCPQSMEPPSFEGPLFETKLLPNLAILAAQDEKQVVLPAAWFGASAIILFAAFIIYSLAPIARLINREPGHNTSGARLNAWITSLVGTLSIAGIGYGAYATYEASEFLLLLGLLGWTRWFAITGLLTGLGGAMLIWQTVRARTNEALPVGVLVGLFLTGFAAIALTAFILIWGPRPF